uniref:OTU domain-containing protein n=1 Tax=Lactuca sativa TaxID=4236 RepID=A0A9R1WFH0_LACSA|nr:hypothetical protein LSAT_V11C200063430 [Lactuca sativa]
MSGRFYDKSRVRGKRPWDQGFQRGSAPLARFRGNAPSRVQRAAPQNLSEFYIWEHSGKLGFLRVIMGRNISSESVLTIQVGIQISTTNPKFLTTYLINYAKLESKSTYHLGTKQVVDYLNRFWLDKYKEKITNQVLNFHNHTNNRVESQHVKSKKFLQTQHANLDKKFNRIEKLMCRYNIPHFKGLCGNVSHHTLEKIRQELNRSDAHQITEDDYGCQLRHRCGLPYAHEIAIYSRANQMIPLSSTEKFWRKLDLINVNVIDDANFGFEEGVELLKESYVEQSNEQKYSYARKLWDICSPSTAIMFIKNTRGRPRLSKQKSKKVDHNTPPILMPTPTNTRRRGFSTNRTDNMDTSDLDLNQEPERHSTYLFREPSMSNSYFNQDQPFSTYSFREPSMFNSYFNQDQPFYTSNPLINEIPHQFHPYARNITDVEGDGNCGFRSIAVVLGRSEHDWLQIRYDLYNELLSHYQEYAMIYGDHVDFLNRVGHSLNYSGSGFAILECRLIMPNTAIFIANRYGVIVIYLSKQGYSTWFLHRYGP